MYFLLLILLRWNKKVTLIILTLPKISWLLTFLKFPNYCLYIRSCYPNLVSRLIISVLYHIMDRLLWDDSLGLRTERTFTIYLIVIISLHINKPLYCDHSQPAPATSWHGEVRFIRAESFKDLDAKWSII